MPPPAEGESSFVGWVSQLPVVGVSNERKVSQMLTSEVLNRAADLIEADGWAIGIDAMSVDGPHCVEGAIQAAQGGTIRGDRPGFYDYLEDECPAYLAVKSHLADRAPHRYLYAWNDKPDRTSAEVVEVLRATAAIEQARESQPSVVSA